MRSLALRSLAVLVACTLTSQVYAQQKVYRIVPILIPEDTAQYMPYVEVSDLNDQGEVLGVAQGDGYGADGEPVIGDDRHPFIWSQGVYRELPIYPHSSEMAPTVRAINNLSAVVGNAVDRNGSNVGIRYNRGNVTEIHAFAGESSVDLVDINVLGQIAGTSYNATSKRRGFVWRNGGVTALAPLPGGNATEVRAINRRGTVLGQTIDSQGTPHPTLWHDGEPSLVHGPSDSEYFDATAIDDRDRVIGYTSAGGWAAVGYLIENGEAKQLPAVNQTQFLAVPAAISNAGIIVGVTAWEGSSFTATIWIGDHAYDLNTLIRDNDPLKTTVHLDRALRVNQLGQIIAWDDSGKSYLVTPTNF